MGFGQQNLSSVVLSMFADYRATESAVGDRGSVQSQSSAQCQSSERASFSRWRGSGGSCCQQWPWRVRKRRWWLRYTQTSATSYPCSSHTVWYLQRHACLQPNVFGKWPRDRLENTCTLPVVVGATHAWNFHRSLAGLYRSWKIRFTRQNYGGSVGRLIAELGNDI